MLKINLYGFLAIAWLLAANGLTAWILGPLLLPIIDSDNAYVTGLLKDNSGRTTGYVIKGRGEVTVADAIKLTNEGGIDNVIVVTNKNGRTFLRTKKNAIADDNLTA